MRCASFREVFFIVILRHLCFVILTIFIVISSEARNLILRNAMHFFHRVTAKPPTQCGFRLAVRKGTKQATSTTFCNALQNCAESAVFAQCHSEPKAKNLETLRIRSGWHKRSAVRHKLVSFRSAKH